MGCTESHIENYSAGAPPKEGLIGPDVVISYLDKKIQWCATNLTSIDMHLFIYPNPGFPTLYWVRFENNTIFISTLYGEWRGIKKDRGEADNIPYGIRELVKSSKVCDTIALEEYPIGTLVSEVPSRGQIYFLDPWTLNPFERNLYGASIVFETGWLPSDDIIEFKTYSLTIKTIDHKKYHPILKHSNTIIAK